MAAALVQIDPCEFGQFMSETEADKNPILQSGAQLVLALLDGLAKGDDARQFWNSTGETALFELIVARQLHRRFNVRRQRKGHGRKLVDSAVLARF